MLSRRGFLLATTAVMAQDAAAPTGVVMIIGHREAPVAQDLAPRAVRFTRSYAADPSVVRGRDAILRGRFPHLGGLTGDPGGVTLIDHLAAAGWPGAPSIVAGLKSGRRYCTVLEPAAGAGIATLKSALEMLGRAGAVDDTLLVFTACRNGDDETWFDRYTRVPLLVQWPRRVAPAELDLLASAVDVLPTVLGLCGARAPNGIQGRDLTRWLLNASGGRPESIYAEGRIGTRQSWRMLVRGLDKLVFTPGLEILRLYNLGQDPDETTDLSGSPGFERRIDELRAIAADWMRRLSDHQDPSGLKRR